MSSRGSALLDRLLAEVRAQRPPPTAADDLPPQLRAEFRSAAAGWRAAPSRPARPATRRWLPVLALAAAGASALVLARSGGVPAPGAPPAASAVLDGQPLEVGALVVATDQARRVEHAGHASWELEPGSRARVLSYAGGVLRVSLEQGSLTAEVQPSAQPESFVVQADGTEVAVHGTRFRVSLVGDHVRVSVAQGQVQVRPLALAPAALPSPGTALRAGMQADFWAGKTEPTLEPLPERDVAPAPSGAVQRAAHPPRPGSSPEAKRAAGRSAVRAAPSPTPGAASQTGAHGTTSASGSAPLPAPSVPAASVEQALQTVIEQAQSCFRQQLPGSIEIGIEVSTRLGLWVEPDGELLRADFDPPLAPAVEHCVAAKLANLRVARSLEGFRVEREIRLRR
jgi:ferric-dicitrate binding protein FerR (iron transport regulator)